MTSSQENFSYAKSFVATLNNEIEEPKLVDSSLNEFRKNLKDEKIYYTNSIDDIKLEGFIVLKISKIDYSYEDMFLLSLYDEFGSIKGCCTLDLIEANSWKVNDTLILKNCSVWDGEFLNITENNLKIN